MTDVTPPGNPPTGTPNPATPPPANPPPANQPPPSSSSTPPTHDDDDTDTDDVDSLDDKRAIINALRKERRERRELMTRTRTAERQLAEARGRLTQADRLRASVLEHAVTAAAAGMVADPHDVVRLIDLSDIVVGDDGSIDTAKIKSRVEDLVKSKPYLAAPNNGGGGGAPRPLPGGAAPTSAGFNDWLRRSARGA